MIQVVDEYITGYIQPYCINAYMTS